jgi:hypothetical protein
VADTDTYEDDQAPASARKSGDPPPRLRRRPLDNLMAVRREISRIYWECRDNRLPIEQGKGLTYLLSQIVVTLKVEQADEGLQRLVDEVRKKMEGKTP